MNKEKDKLSDTLETLYFGGGTPSLLNSQLISQIKNEVSKNIQINKDCEISIELDPGTFNHEKLNEFVDIGVNRISMGVQTFN